MSMDLLDCLRATELEIIAAQWPGPVWWPGPVLLRKDFSFELS